MATNPETEPAELLYTWCDAGTVGDGGSSPGDVDPTGGDVEHGWPDTATPPARQRFNWVFKWLTQAVRFLLHHGIPDYKATRYYTTGDRVQGSNGRTYVALQANGPSAAKDPTTQATYWAEWGNARCGVDASALVTSSDATVASAKLAYFGAEKRLTFALTSVPYNKNTITVNLSGDADLSPYFALGGAVCSDSLTSTPNVQVTQLAAHAITVYVKGITMGATGTVYVQLLG